jgi:hypothetical protein
MIEGPFETAAAYLTGILRRERERKAEAARDRRIRVIRNQPRNSHAWKGKR